MTDSVRLLGVVLCGGESSRMGQNKSFLQRADGTTYLQYALQRIAQVCDEVGISCHEPLETEHHLIRDPVAHHGPAVGIAASLQFADQHSFQACMFSPVDMPNLSINELFEIKRAWRRSNCLTVAQGDQLQPLVGVYPVSLREEIERLAASDDRSLTNWMKSQRRVTVTLSESACHNINRPEDLFDGP